MFLKPFKIKSNVILKGSDRKKLLNSLKENFPDINLDELIPTKGELSCLKIVTFKDGTVLAYCQAQNPIFIQVEGTLLPTVYTLWKFPKLLPTVATCSYAYHKMSGGADLMLPGVEVASLQGLESVVPGDRCAIRISDTQAPIGVGVFLLSGAQLNEIPRKGKAVSVFHLYKDQLWASGNKSHPPSLDPSRDSNQDDLKEIEEGLKDMIVEVEATLSKEEEEVNEADVQPSEENTHKDSKEDDETEGASKSPAEQMDELLINCFLIALKNNGKKITLPILTSTFYKTHVLSQCPSDKQIDVKKSSFKKISNFLKDMQAKGLIQVKELSKGVESIVALTLKHELLRGVCSTPPPVVPSEAAPAAAIEEEFEPPVIRELFAISSNVLPVFKGSFKKNDILAANQIRMFLTDYVKKNEINYGSLVQLDGPLTDMLVNRGENIERMSWEEMNSRCLAKMNKVTELSFPGEAVPIVKKGKIEPIEISVCKRTGNKKVTLVYNLETFRIDPNKLAHQIQLIVAASTSVGPPPNGRKGGLQVMVQGSQERHITKLLLETYKIPTKYIKGCETNVKKQK